MRYGNVPNHMVGSTSIYLDLINTLLLISNPDFYKENHLNRKIRFAVFTQGKVKNVGWGIAEERNEIINIELINKCKSSPSDNMNMLMDIGNPQKTIMLLLHSSNGKNTCRAIGTIGNVFLKI